MDFVKGTFQAKRLIYRNEGENRTVFIEIFKDNDIKTRNTFEE